LDGGGNSFSFRLAYKSDASQVSAVGWDVDAELCESGHGVGHKAFAAGFIDGRRHTVGDLDA
jgi:hypothetical protein